MRRLTRFIHRRGDADMPAETGQPRAIRLPRWRGIAYGMLMVFVAGSAAAIIADRQRLADMLIVASAQTGLQLEYIEVYGRAHTPRDTILAASELTLGEPMLGISLRDLHARLSTIGWIEDVAIEREMPSTIRLLLTERMPMALLLAARGADATVTVVHSRTEDVADRCREADVIVAAVGRPDMVQADWVKPGATVVDVGINRVDDDSRERGWRLAGDVHPDVSGVAAWLSPVPGGVGPMTIAMLMANTVRAAEGLQ